MPKIHFAAEATDFIKKTVLASSNDALAMSYLKNIEATETMPSLGSKELTKRTSRRLRDISQSDLIFASQSKFLRSLTLPTTTVFLGRIINGTQEVK
jgi:hypothetical protein